MQVNLKGFESIVDALGGISVNINYKVPIGGDYKGPGPNDDILPKAYLQPGPNQKLNGHDALWFARGRYGLDDASRQERQRCTIHAIVNSANPATLVTKYQQIASASKKLLQTDIPQEILPAFIELGLKVKGAKVTNVDLDKKKNFPSGQNPDYEAMAQIVQNAIEGKTAGRHHHRYADQEAVGRQVEHPGQAPGRWHRGPQRRLRVPPGQPLTGPASTAAVVPGEILARCVRRTGCGQDGSSGSWPPG